MEHDQFDRLTKRFAAGATRRSILRTMVGGAAALLGTALGRETTDAKPKGGPGSECKVGCAGFNRQAKTACEKACKECGGDIDRVCADEGPFGPAAFTCCAEGTFCVGDGVCCAEGTEPCFGPEGVTCCPAGTFCNFGTGACVTSLRVCFPAEAQCVSATTCSPESGCGGEDCADGCFCVSSTEGEGACVSGEFADCGAPSCETSADCGAGGTCVDATACCGGGSGDARTITPGWRQ
jgi:hypothetical protein